MYLVNTSVLKELGRSMRITFAPKSDRINPAKGAGARPAISSTTISLSGNIILFVEKKGP